MKHDWTFRQALPQDIPFIYSSWLKSYKHDSDFAKTIRTGIFFDNYREVLDDILERADVIVACLPNDKDIIIGYLVYEAHAIHYSFVKESFRNLGVARSMFKEIYKTLLLPVSYTHITNTAKPFSKSYDFIYNPILLFNKGDE